MESETLEFLAELEREHQQIPSNDAIVASGERECPICKQKMHVEQQHGTKLDVCSEHGFWLDRGELHAVVKRVQSGERIKRDQLVKQLRSEVNASGAFFGVWPLLFD